MTLKVPRARSIARRHRNNGIEISPQRRKGISRGAGRISIVGRLDLQTRSTAPSCDSRPSPPNRPTREFLLCCWILGYASYPPEPATSPHPAPPPACSGAKPASAERLRRICRLYWIFPGLWRHRTTVRGGRGRGAPKKRSPAARTSLKHQAKRGFAYGYRGLGGLVRNLQ